MKKIAVFLTALTLATVTNALSITVSQDDVDVTLDSFCGQYGYKDTVKDEKNQDIPNPESKLDFATRKVQEFIQESAIAYDVNVQVLAARNTAITNGKLAHSVNATGVLQAK